MASKNPITKAWMLEVLADRAWHPQYELINLASRLLKPEVASRKFYKGTRSRVRDPEKTEIDKAVLYGTKTFVQNILSDLRRDGIIEYRGNRGSEERESRLISWYCWSCGRLQTSERPESGLCGECPEYCWECGSVLDEDALDKDHEICNKCKQRHDTEKLRQANLESMLVASTAPIEQTPTPMPIPALSVPFITTLFGIEIRRSNRYRKKL